MITLCHMGWKGGEVEKSVCMSPCVCQGRGRRTHEESMSTSAANPQQAVRGGEERGGEGGRGDETIRDKEQQGQGHPV